MRTKGEILNELSIVDTGINATVNLDQGLLIEVLIDIRDQLAEVAKLRYAKLGNTELIYSKGDE